MRRRPGRRVSLTLDMESTALAEPPVAVDPLVSLRGVHKVFARRGRTVVALAGVDLRRSSAASSSASSGRAAAGSRRCCGSSAGSRGRSRRRSTIAGASPTIARAAKQYGLVPQTPALLPWATVGDNVRFLTG